MFIIDVADFPDSSPIFFFHERISRQPGLHDLHRHKTPDDLGPKAQDIGIRMLPCKCSTHGVLADSSVTAADLICNQSTSITDAVTENTSVALSL